jgi:hypothetical protein
MVARAPLTVVAAMLIGAKVCMAAFSPDITPDPTISQWFKGLKQPNTSQLCCSISDCHRVAFRKTDDGRYEIAIEGRWYKVPEATILRQKGNPTGSAVACYNTVPGYATLPGVSAHDRVDHIEIMCFVPELPTS